MQDQRCENRAAECRNRDLGLAIDWGWAFGLRLRFRGIGLSFRVQGKEVGICVRDSGLDIGLMLQVRVRDLGFCAPHFQRSARGPLTSTFFPQFFFFFTSAKAGTARILTRSQFLTACFSVSIIAMKLKLSLDKSIPILNLT